MKRTKTIGPPMTLGNMRTGDSNARRTIWNPGAAMNLILRHDIWQVRCGEKLFEEN
jgi:hypothetical protein